MSTLCRGPEVNDEVECELSSIRRDCYVTVVPRLVASVSSRFESSAVFFTDGSKGEAGTGFGVYQLNGGEISFRLQEPSGVFTSELSAIFMALVQIRDHHPGEFIIFSDSMSSVSALQTQIISPRTHSLVYEIKEASWRLERHGYGVHNMWIPSHVGLMGNKRVDRLAGDAFRGDTEFATPVRPSDFRLVSRVRMLDGWQCSWSKGGMGRFDFASGLISILV
jgi:ribonuclease HI